MTLKDAFEIEDTNNGYVNLNQLEEVIHQLDLDFDNGKLFWIMFMIFRAT